MSVLMMQIKHLFWLYVVMKRWKFLWSIPVFLALTSNHFLFPIVDRWMGTMGQTYVDLGAKEFAGQNIILTEEGENRDRIASLTQLLAVENPGSPSKLEYCSGQTACESKIFTVLYGRIDSNKYSNYITYGLDANVTTPAIQCQNALGGELNCPYLGYLAAMSKQTDFNDYRFKEIRFFSLTSRKEGKKTDSVRGEDTMCAKHDNIEAVYSRTVMLQCMLIAGTVYFYFLLSTLACIAELKRDGFMHLMFQKGFSVRAYWTVMGGVSLAEVLLFAFLYIVSLAIQCSGYFDPVYMLAVFILALFNLLGLGSLCILFTIIASNYFYVGLLTALAAITTMTLILINRLVFSTIIWLKFMLLVLFPLGHFGEFVQGVMLAEIRMQKMDAYMITIMLVSIILPVGIWAAIFILDFHLEHGNGFKLPIGFWRDDEFWAASTPVPDDEKQDPLYGMEPDPSSNIEMVTENLRPLVRMHQLSKTFENSSCCNKGTAFTAIKGMSALIYENHITAIIGHNGAGKTTLLNLLTGVETPTTGQVSICGILASSPMARQRLRGKLGICPQNMIFASTLTVEQTIQLSMVSCGVEWQDCSEEIDNVLHLIRMDRKRHQVLGPMSIGQQRKLAVAMALLGSPQVVFLDEPTSGLDPASRRRMWSLLQKYRLGRAIIMSTQFMDEADTLADRKMFLSAGHLICAGSSLFFKSTFDCGFVFDVTLKNEKHSPLLKRQICDEFKSVKAKNKFGNNLNFRLPARDIDFLPALAQSLEKRMELISAFGLQQASLYDIFMRLKDLDESAVAELFSEDHIGQAKLEEAEVDSDLDADRKTRLSCAMQSQERVLNPSPFRQLRAMIVVNVTRLVRTRVRLACRAFVPIFLLLTLIANAVVERGNENHSLHLRTNMTNSGDSLYGICVSDNSTDKVARRYANSDDQRCSWLFSDSNPGKINYLALNKPSEVPLASFLQQPDVVDQMRKTYNRQLKKNPDSGPCPVVYTPDWRVARNPDRVIQIGSYSIYETKNASTAASVSMGAAQRAIRFFSKNYKGSVDSFFYLAESVFDYRSMFVPTLGAFFQMIMIAFIPATFLDDIIEDKEKNVRSQLASMGMGCLSYWLNNFFVHWLQYAVFYSLSSLVLQAVVQVGYSTTFYIAGVFLPTLFIGLPCNQFLVYLLSTLIDRSNILVTILYFFFSIFLACSILVVQLNNVASVIMIALLPPYAVVALTFYGTKTIFYTLSFYRATKLSDISALSSSFYFSQPHVVAAFGAIIVHTILLLATLVLIENRIILLQRLESYLKQHVVVVREEKSEDPGVQEEVERVDADPRSEKNLLEVRHLGKTYSDGTKVVRDITFATGAQEIFGLLGPNGAGKSTTLSMIVGQLETSQGRCEVRKELNSWVPSGHAASLGGIGYCPQYDPLYDCLSVMEHMEFYANILGVSPQTETSTVASLVEALDLDTTAGKTADQLSVGNRRRLSLAISLLGDPTIIVIDEATTGVDPEGKRFLWHAIRSMATVNRSIIVTTHSMEEVEALCNRVSVLNRGLMVGLGTVQQLKTRYGHSYSLEIMISTTIGENQVSLQTKKIALVTAVTKKFANTSIMEEFNDRIHFSIPTASVHRLSQALSWLIDNKNQLKIHYFSFHQMSMDQVFERMVKQHEKLIKSQRRTSIYSLSSGSQSESVV